MNEIKITSTKDLRSFLLDQIVSVANGSQEPGQAKAICNYAQQVYNTMNMELKYAKMSHDMEGVEVREVSF